ncbi:NAD(P)H-dependent flavin oxidoreductase [Amycolatopsis thermophila]|uniref:Nitronate monooxygenase n=1 Tax=Amycolatopsis thermophila TaxID=206084 RepID=A0ABU0EL98_9PSEU|nr:nitronate monooxygenase [Amycolatopsis thermophila]MDQ0376053.1 nitronate monooxygenase [Amycolatopsis thermophila]
MTAVSGPDLVIAACRHGVVGSFPTHNARSPAQLGHWLTRMREVLPAAAAPVAPNLVVHRSNPRLADDVACLVRHRVEVVITSVGSPEPVIQPLHDAGALVFADVATMRHVDRALAAGADGLVLLSAGAGGQTGWNNPFAFVRAVREGYDGPVVLAGGVSDGVALFAARMLGADLAYMGTRFIATEESLAGDDYRRALVEASLDDIVLSRGPSGLPANFLAGSFAAAGSGGSGEHPATFDFRSLVDPPRAWAAGHTAHGVRRVQSVAELVESTRAEYHTAHRAVPLDSLAEACPAGKEF